MHAVANDGHEVADMLIGKGAKLDVQATVRRGTAHSPRARLHAHPPPRPPPPAETASPVVVA